MDYVNLPQTQQISPVPATFICPDAHRTGKCYLFLIPFNGTSETISNRITVPVIFNRISCFLLRVSFLFPKVNRCCREVSGRYLLLLANLPEITLSYKAGLMKCRLITSGCIRELYQLPRVFSRYTAKKIKYDLVFGLFEFIPVYYTTIPRRLPAIFDRNLRITDGCTRKIVQYPWRKCKLPDETEKQPREITGNEVKNNQNPTAISLLPTILCWYRWVTLQYPAITNQLPRVSIQLRGLYRRFNLLCRHNLSAIRKKSTAVLLCPYMPLSMAYVLQFLFRKPLMF